MTKQFMCVMLTIAVLASVAFCAAPADKPILATPKTPLMMRIMQPTVEWLKYYDTVSPDTSVFVYNILEIIKAFNDQQARITALETRIKALEDKGKPVDPNVPKGNESLGSP